MKKILSLITIGALTLSLCACATTNNVIPKAPKMTATLKPIVAKYKKGDYVGSMQDLEELVKKEKNNTYAKYYLALCYTRLGYKEDATKVYQEVVKKNDNLVLSYYSQKALDCLDNPDSPICTPKTAKQEAQSAELDDIDLFIQSGKQIHPAAMDRITKERMERKIMEEEYIRTQQQQGINPNEQLKSQAPTNEEIASALNTLSKIGINPYTQFNPLAQVQQYNQYGMLGMNNPMMYGALINNNNPEMAKMLLYNQMSQQGNMLNYGI